MAFQIKTIFSVLYKTVFDIILYTLIVCLVLALLPNHLFTNFPMEPIGYESDRIPETLSDWNNLLAQRSDLLLNGLIVGPESMAEKNEFIYTGLADGRLVEIDKNSLKIRDITRFGTKNDCSICFVLIFILIILKSNFYLVPNVFWRLTECGRPLGLRFHKDQYLYVLDAFEGLFRINSTTGQKEFIDFDIEDKLKGIYNDFVFDPILNVVYITVSSTKWHLDRVPYSILDYEDSGHVFALDLNTKKTLQLRTGFRFTNGIEITKDNKYLLISETVMFKIHKISLQNVHKAIKQIADNEMEVFAEDLPGEPDNIRLDPNGDVWVGIFLVRNEGKTLRDYLSNWPFLRKAFSRSLYVLSLIIDYLNTNICNNHALEMMAFDLYSGHLLYKFMPKNGAVLKLDAKTGQIKQLLGSNQFNGVSEAFVDSEGDLYFGSFRNQFLGRIKEGKF